MNLIDAPWIPVRRASGARSWVAPWQITDDIDGDPITALDAARPDFNGALIQFLIGLVQTTTAMDSLEDWEDAMSDPPNPEMLKAQFDTVRFAFEFDGDGPRFMQDLTLGASDATENHIAALLIETPGGQAEERNSDHFVKRGANSRMCSACAATALFTLHTNAPAGGQGNRTSLRGGGPLTTLIASARQRQTDPAEALWKNVWLNVMSRSEFLSGCDSTKKEPHFSFPWLSPIETLQPQEETQPTQVHPTQMYWAMPRRIRLNFEGASAGECAVCGNSRSTTITNYIARNYGMNYKGPWRHPLSPYYRQKEQDAALPMHPQPGGLGYRHWLGWVLGISQDKKRIEPAKVVQAFVGGRRSRGRYRLWAFGYDMDNMKARCWYEATFPLYDISDRRTQELVSEVVGRAVSAAEWAALCTKNGIKYAWFGDVAEVRGSLDFVTAAFWSRTESAFYSVLEQFVSKARDAIEFEDTLAIRESWRESLIRAASKIFDEFAASGNVVAANPKRIADAHRSLKTRLYGDELLERLGIALPERSKKRKTRVRAQPVSPGAMGP